MNILKLVLLLLVFIIFPCMAVQTDFTDTILDNLSDLNNYKESINLTDIVTIHNNPDEFIYKFYIIDGIVSLVFSQKNQFILSEVGSCPVCAYAQSPDNTLLISYFGKLPEKRENVRVYGFLTRNNQDQLQFIATAIKIK